MLGVVMPRLGPSHGHGVGPIIAQEGNEGGRFIYNRNC